MHRLGHGVQGKMVFCVLFTILDFLFCPIHGLLRPTNWPILAPLLVSGMETMKHCVRCVCSACRRVTEKRK